MNKVLVTGAAGFIGSYLLEYLLERGDEVVGIDNFSSGNYRHAQIMNLDLVREPEKVTKLIARFRPAVVYHLAAWARENQSLLYPKTCWEENLNAYVNVLLPAIKHGMKRVVITSSASVYGDRRPPFTETMSRKPKNIYGLAKAAMEETTAILARVHQFEYAIVRLYNVYGPRQGLGDPYRNVVAIFINSLLQGKPCRIYGDGKQERGFSYITDVVEPLARAGWVKGVGDEVINIGSEEQVTIKRLVEILGRHFPQALKSVYLPARPEEVRRVYLSNKKGRELLGYRTKVNLQDGIERTVAWARDHGPVPFQYETVVELPMGKVGG